MKIMNKALNFLVLGSISFGVITPIITNSIKNKEGIEKQSEKTIKKYTNFLNDVSSIENPKENIFQNVEEKTKEEFQILFDKNEKNFKNSKYSKNFNIKNDSTQKVENYVSEEEKMDKIFTNYKKLKSGELKIKDILKMQENYYEKNKEQFNNFLEKENETIDKLGNLSEKKSYINNVNKQTNTNISSDEITVKNLENVKNFRKNLEKLKNYENSLYGLAIASSTLTAVAWASAAFYWTSAFWSWGATIPAAVASTIQASLLTYFTNESFNTYYDVQRKRYENEKILNDGNFEITEKIANQILSDFKNGKYKSDSAKSLATNLGLVTNVPWLAKVTIKKVVSKIVDHFFGSRIANFLAKSANAKIILKSTSWATPIGFIITAIDIAITSSNLITAIVFSS